MYPVLVAAGAEPALRWLRQGRKAARRSLLIAALVVSAVESVVITLPVTPVSNLHKTSVAYDVGETVDWPAYVSEIAAAYRGIPAAVGATVAILGSNYGESGAVDRFGGSLGLPHACGVHMGYWYWGPPPAAATSVLAIGFNRAQVARFCADPVLLARLDNHVGLNNDEQGAPPCSCTALQGMWKELWPHLKDIG
jgi:hypothetical protein